MNRRRLTRAYFHAMQRLCTTRSLTRYRQLLTLASNLASTLAGRDRRTFFRELYR